MSHNVQELKITTKNVTLSIFGIIISSMIIRLWFYPYDLPITHDGDTFFSYAIDTVISGKIPQTYTLPNNGWPIILSLFFNIFNFDSALEYMNLQRSLSIVVSALTIIPVYLLCRRFFSQIIAIVGCGLFAFSPQILQNSLLGTTEPLYICLITISVFLFLSKKINLVYCSFWIIALASIIRYEGIILLIPFSIIFFIKFQSEKKIIIKYIIVIGIVVLILLPIALIRIETTNNDGFTNVLRGPQYIIQTSSTDPDEDEFHKNFFDFVIDGISGLFKFTGWSMIPYFILFAPLGAIMLFKNIDLNKKTIVIISIFLFAPALYAYSREFQEIKYLFALFPIFSCISLYTIEYIFKKTNNPKIILTMIFTGIVISSIIFINFQLDDYETKREMLEISRYVFNNTDGVNHYNPGSGYLNYVRYEIDNFPMPRYDYESPNILWDYYDPNSGTNYTFDSIEKYVEFGQSRNLTHIVTNGHNADPDILNDLFFNENNYPYVEKQFDSFENGFKINHIKIFKINFELFDKYNNND